MSRARVTFIVSIVFISVMVVAIPLSAQTVVTIDMAITGAQLRAAVSNPTGGTPSPDPFHLRYLGEGKLLLVDNTVSNADEVFLIDISGSTPQFRRLVGGLELRAKVGAVSGQSAPTVMTVRDVDMDGHGNLIVATDGGQESAYLFSVSPEGNITLLSGRDAPTGSLSSIEGLTAMVVNGTTAYVVLRAFAMSADTAPSVVTVSTTAPDGGATAATLLTSSVDLFNVIPGGDFVPSAVAQIRPSNGNLLILNSGAAGTSDDIIEINTETGEPSILVAGADIRADINTPEVGYNQFAIAADDTLYLANTFGNSSDAATNRAILRITSPGNGVGNARVLAPEAQVIGSPAVTTVAGAPLSRLFYPDGGMAVTESGAVLFTERNSGGVIRLTPR